MKFFHAWILNLVMFGATNFADTKNRSDDYTLISDFNHLSKVRALVSQNANASDSHRALSNRHLMRVSARAPWAQPANAVSRRIGLWSSQQTKGFSVSSLIGANRMRRQWRGRDVINWADSPAIIRLCAVGLAIPSVWPHSFFRSATNTSLSPLVCSSHNTPGPLFARSHSASIWII
jgi:hypothetical protein